MRVFLVGLTAATLAAIGGPALAHHSFAMFDRTKETTLVGVIKEFQWTNPHSWVQISVPQANGQAVEWSIESSSPSSLARQGWKRNSLQAGQKVTLTINPLRSGEHGGNFVRAVLPDGSVLGRASGSAEGAAQ